MPVIVIPYQIFWEGGGGVEWQFIVNNNFSVFWAVLALL